MQSENTRERERVCVCVTDNLSESASGGVALLFVHSSRVYVGVCVLYFGANEQKKKWKIGKLDYPTIPFAKHVCLCV